MTATYFTCTLGQATALGLTDTDFRNINKFIASRAESTPHDPAVGVARPSSNQGEPWGSSTWSFSEVHNVTDAVAKHLSQVHRERLKTSKTVALICPSTAEFLFTWLGLMRLGHAVLLIAPQCQPAAIAHLCKTCETSIIFHDETYAAQSQEAAQVEGANLMAVALPFDSHCTLEDLATRISDDFEVEDQVRSEDVAYLHHTSGTSSGVPKPIPQTHRAGAGVLPAFPDGKRCATFTTTPLYHGGIADLLRAWASSALIWLFPGKGIPITASNILKCLDSAARETTCNKLPPVRYFSSVPYVLQMLEADPHGLKRLQDMDIVGVGGAALPTEVGDRMVANGVNLISRFGSAECGFLMSSHREYGKDKEWQYLRSDEGADYLKFEKQEVNLAELVVVKGWPHMAKHNRDDGSYATADLFARHESIPNAWRYDSRADSQLTLITGKKFDPAPLEGAISASILLDDVLIFGNGKPFPGALLFRSETARNMIDDEVKDELWPLIEKLNKGSQDHARIPQKMVTVMPVLDTPLEKSSKGTIIRGATESRFATSVEEAYTNMSSSIDGNDISDDDVSDHLIQLIESIVAKPQKLETDTDLFSYGVDSVAGMQIRYGMRQLLPPSSRQLPLNVVEDCGTVARLTEYIVKQRHGHEFHDDEDEHELMLRLVDQYSKFRQRPSRQSINGDDGHANITLTGQEDSRKGGGKDVILLTGATGALGAHVLDLYRNLQSVAKVYCLVRGGADGHESRERVSKSLKDRGLRGLSIEDSNVEVLQTSLGDERLGLSERDYQRLASDISIVMHIAWSVNFRMRLRSFEENISSVTNLINLALSSGRSQPAKFAFCSSVASVMAYSGSESTIPEQVIDDPAASTGLGYSRSKWVAEKICARAGDQTPLRGLVAIFRVGQLAGDRDRGCWNTNEAWPLMLSSVKLTRTLPALEEITLDWLPVDIAALALSQGITGVDGSGQRVEVLHVLNDNRVPEWPDLLEWLRMEKAFDTESPAKWVSRLEDVHEKGATAGHPAFRLLGLWKKAYGDTKNLDGEGSRRAAPNTKLFDLVKTKRLIPCMRDIQPVDQEYFLKLWKWIDKHM